MSADDDYPLASRRNATLENGEVSCCLGIDEAGRGPVLGPMAYGVAYWAVERSGAIHKRYKFNDSKQTKESVREQQYRQIVDSDEIGFIVELLSADYLSNAMTRTSKYNMNAVSHDAAKRLIRAVRARGVHVAEVYVDTVGDPAKYQAKLQAEFPTVGKIVVEKKADALFPQVSAASICAKVLRDRHVRRHAFAEERAGTVAFSRSFGSGYSGDPATKAWLRAHLDPVFGYPDFVRFSWKTTQRLVFARAVRVRWGNSDEDDDPDKQTNNKRQRTAADPSQRTIDFWNRDLQPVVAEQPAAEHRFRVHRNVKRLRPDDANAF